MKGSKKLKAKSRLAGKLGGLQACKREIAKVH